MNEWELFGDKGWIAINGRKNTVGIVSVDGITDNQTRSAIFTPRLLKLWAEAAMEAYGSEARIIFTPDNPVIATDYDKDRSGFADIGIAVAPRAPPEDFNDE